MIRYNKVSVNSNKLKRFDINLKKTSKAYKEIKNTNLKLLLDNYNNNNNLNSNFYSIFFKLYKINNKIKYKNNKKI